MTKTYTITITSTESGQTLATVTVDPVVPRLTEIRPEMEANRSVPAALASIDFSLIIQAAAALSGRFQKSGIFEVPRSDFKSEPNPPKAMNDRLLSPKQAVRSSKFSSALAQSIDLSCDNKKHEGENPVANTHLKPPVTPDANSAGIQDPAMPSDFRVNYWKLRVLEKVARHYDVPNQIARAWIKSLQQQDGASFSRRLSEAVSLHASEISHRSQDEINSSFRTPSSEQSWQEQHSLPWRQSPIAPCPTCRTKPGSDYDPIQFAADIEFRWYEADKSSDNPGGLFVTRHCAKCQPAERFAVECAAQPCDAGPLLGGELATQARAFKGGIPESVLRLLTRRGWTIKGPDELRCPQHSNLAE
ncbi:hypothetical protein [Nocardia asteroides]|uniref:hypothetical protein n=1 Tax=Nocardia asteroides TaxID=1824 RepID=UPI00343BFE68